MTNDPRVPAVHKYEVTYKSILGAYDASSSYAALLKFAQDTRVPLTELMEVAAVQRLAEGGV